MATSLADAVVISGIGQSEIGRRLGRDPLQLTADACIAAVDDAGLTLADIDGLTTYPGASLAGPGFSGASLREIHDLLGIKPNWVAGGVELAGQLGAVVDAMLAVGADWPTTSWCGAASGRVAPKGPADARAMARPGGRPSGQLAWQLPYGATAAIWPRYSCALACCVTG